MSDLTCFSRRCIAGAKWLPFRLSLSMQSVHVKPHIHRFQHGCLCLCLHHLIASVLVSCFCNFRQPAGSFHLLNWSRLPVLKLVSCFLESRLFSSHLFFFFRGPLLKFCATVSLRGGTGATTKLWRLNNSLLLLLKNQILIYKCCLNPLMIKVNLISLFCHRTLARLRMADGTPPPHPLHEHHRHHRTRELIGKASRAHLWQSKWTPQQPGSVGHLFFFFLVRSDIISWC